jgi:hypothetical protein
MAKVRHTGHEAIQSGRQAATRKIMALGNV